MVFNFECKSNDDKIVQTIEKQLKVVNRWHINDSIPSFIISNDYEDNYYPELYEDGGMVNCALINKITNKDLLIKIICSCNTMLDRKPSMNILKNINFGENRLFDFYYNFSLRQVAIFHYRQLYGSIQLAKKLIHFNTCHNLNPDTIKMINSIRYSENEHMAIGFIIELKKMKSNGPIFVNNLYLQKAVSAITSSNKIPTFKILDELASTLVESTSKLNSNETFQINYAGPYIPYNKNNNGFIVHQTESKIYFSLQLKDIF